MKIIPTPALSPYGTLSGDLFQYGPNRVAFESPSSAASGLHRPFKCILVGGLGDGLLCTPYTQGLDEICRNSSDSKWSLVQPILSSSYTGFGYSSLDQDVTELTELCSYLAAHRGATDVCFVGHSTGCQDICHLLRKSCHSDSLPRLRAAILQAPVSDREGPAATDAERYTASLTQAQQMCEKGQGQEFMPRDTFWAPITAQRVLDLYETDGADDYFSASLTDAQLADRLGINDGKWPHLDHLLVVFSGADEYIKPGLDTAVHTDRLVQAFNSGSSENRRIAQGLHLADANHNLSVGGLEVFLEHVQRVLRDVNGSEQEE